MIYTIEQIKELAEPIAKKYKLKSIWIFGSYARGEATDESDIDFLIDDTDSKALNLCGFMDMADEFEQKLNKKVDLLSIDTLKGPRMKQHFFKYIDIINVERILLYENS
jgi:predicted nucleotidyltransferase